MKGSDKMQTKVCTKECSHKRRKQKQMFARKNVCV